MAADVWPVAVPRLWPDSTVVCIGSGPSLTGEDVWFCRDKARILAINDAHRIAPFAEVLYTSDLYWLTHHDGVPTFTGRKVSIEKAPGKGPGEHARWPDWTVLRNTGNPGIETDPTGLRTGKNSGAAAINLAVHLGATRIILLGYDMGISPGGPSHFFGEHPRALRASSPYAAFMEMVTTMVQPLKAIGIEVVNCSRRTALTAFRQAALEDVLCG